MDNKSHTTCGKIWEISATELEAANRWNETLARSVSYARQIHGDKILSGKDAADFTAYYVRWLEFADKVTKWSLYERALESNKQAFDSFMRESREMSDRFIGKGMAVVPVPYMGELIFLLRGMPATLTLDNMVTKLATGVEWARKMIFASISTGEWIQKTGITLAAISLLGPAGLLIAYYMPTSWTSDRKGLETAITNAENMIALFKRAPDDGVSYKKRDPVYGEFLRRLTRIYIEAAGLYAIRETQTAATAEAIDQGAKLPETMARPSTYFWLFAIAGAGCLGWAWLARSQNSPINDKLPAASPPPPPPSPPT